MGIFFIFFPRSIEKIVCLPMEEEEIFVKNFYFKKKKKNPIEEDRA
jgi:hypothetical protein